MVQFCILCASIHASAVNCEGHDSTIADCHGQLVSSYIGIPPPPEFVQRSETTSQCFSPDGKLLYLTSQFVLIILYKEVDSGQTW